MKSLTTFAAFLALGISALAAPLVPRPAKEFDFVESSGKHTLLSSYKGKVLVLQFLLTTCPHCQAMSQMLTKLQTELGPKGFQAIGVVFNDPDPGSRVTKADMAQNYYAQFHLNFPITYSSRDTIISFLGDSVMDRLMFPQVMVIDKKGQVRAESEVSGTAQLQQEAYLSSLINDLLKESATSAAPKAAPKSSSSTGKAPVTTAATK